MAERQRTRSVKDAEDDPDQLAPDEAEEEEFAAEDEEFADDEGGLSEEPAEIEEDERGAGTSDGWKIGIEVIEDRRIPSSADILATYRAEMDEDGELVSYQRVRRY